MSVPDVLTLVMVAVMVPLILREMLRERKSERRLNRSIHFHCEECGRALWGPISAYQWMAADHAADCPGRLVELRKERF